MGQEGPIIDMQSLQAFFQPPSSLLIINSGINSGRTNIRSKKHHKLTVTIARLGRDTFDRLVAMLAPNPIFISKGRKPQRHVKYQLACFLMRYGSRGSDVIGTAMKMSIGLVLPPSYTCYSTTLSQVHWMAYSRATRMY